MDEAYSDVFAGESDARLMTGDFGTKTAPE
jgi:hypothetical protein